MRWQRYARPTDNVGGTGSADATEDALIISRLGGKARFLQRVASRKLSRAKWSQARSNCKVVILSKLEPMPLLRRYGTHDC